MFKVLVTGGTGLVGTAIKAVSQCYPQYEFKFVSSKDCNLCDEGAVNDMISTYKPDAVIHLAAAVGGLFKNLAKKSEMFDQNVKINTNVLSACSKYDVGKVVSCLSTCVFPDNVSYPIKESMLHDGPPHYSNEGYAYAKRMLDVQSRMYRDSFNQNFVCVIPTNIYGENDNFILQDAHVVPALIHKCYIAKRDNTDLVVSGSGKPLRQFIYSKDLARLIMWALESYNKATPITLCGGPESEISIGEVAYKIAQAMDFKGNIVFDTTQADGQYKKPACNSHLLNEHGPVELTTMEAGLTRTVEWFMQNYGKERVRV